MSQRFLHIEPKELKFTFELKKQSSCSVQLTNNTHQYVAFKVKTTSPKKYSVRPHVGVLLPKSSCSFIVIMQAQRTALVDLMCKDKFLIQSTIVPHGTTNDDITSSLFVKDASRYIEEEKLKVTLVSPFQSAEASPVYGDIKRGLTHGNDKIFSEDEIVFSEHMVLKKQENNVGNEELKNEKDKIDYEELKHEKDQIDNEELKHEKYLTKLNPEKNSVFEAAKNVDEQENKMDNEELKHEKDMIKLNPEKDRVFETAKNVDEQKPEKAAVEVSKDLELNIAKDRMFEAAKNVGEQKPENAAVEVSQDLELNIAKNAEELKSEKAKELKTANGVEELILMDYIEKLEKSKDADLNTAMNAGELKLEKEAILKVSKGIEEMELMSSVEEMKRKLDEFESKLNEAGVTISKLREERMASSLETKILQEKLADMSKRDARKVQVGFPFLYVCMVALICVFLGYRLHSP